MTFFQAVLYGLIQGLTEFIPISSTAHLRVVPALLGWEDPGAAFTAVIQWGTWVAAVIYFRDDVWRITAGFFRGLPSRPLWKSADAKMAWMICLGTFPVVVCGVLFKKWIENELRSLFVIACAAIVLALVMLLAELVALSRKRAGKNLTLRSDHHGRIVCRTEPRDGRSFFVLALPTGHIRRRSIRTVQGTPRVARIPKPSHQPRSCFGSGRGRGLRDHCLTAPVSEDPRYLCFHHLPTWAGFLSVVRLGPGITGDCGSFWRGAIRRTTNFTDSTVFTDNKLM
jgi:hypothetical protein